MRNRVLFIIWFIVVVIIFGLLSALGFIYKGKVDSYNKYEEKLVCASKIYIKDNNLVPKEGKTVKVSIDDLIEAKLIKKKDTIKECKGYIEVERRKLINYYPKLKCKYYKSK